MVLIKLAIANLLGRKVRGVLTVAAIALSVSLIVSVTSGYQSMESAFLKFLNRYMGGADAFVSTSDMQGGVPATLLTMLRADGDVRDAVGRLESQRMLPRKGGGQPPASSPNRLSMMPAGMTNVHLIGIVRPGDTQTEAMDVTEGQWFEGASGDVAVLDQAAAERLGVKVGDEVELSDVGGKKLALKVVGLVHQPDFFAERRSTLYMPLETLQHFTGQDNPPLVGQISIRLRRGADFGAFKKRWTERLGEIDPNVTMRLTRDNEGDIASRFLAVRILSYFGGTVSMITAMFIIFSALSMGVTERQRTLAMLRAIGATRGQIAGLVVVEAMVFAVVGVAAGTLLGILWAKLLSVHYSDVFTAGAVVSWGGVLFAWCGSLVTALAASLLPAYSATRVSPLEAMNAQGAGAGRNRAPVGWAALGVALVAIDPLLFFGPLERVMSAVGVGAAAQQMQTLRLFAHFLVGLPALMLGFLLMAPLFVWVIERFGAGALARGMALPPALLRQQLSGGMWRAAGTAAALMVGLAVLIVMQVQGNTLIGGWRLPDQFPDIFIYGNDIISWQDQAKLADVPGIEPGTLMPCVVTSAYGERLDLLAAAAMLGSSNPLFIAIEPDQALKMVQLEFRDDSGKAYPADQQAACNARASEELKKGRRIIVTEEFRRARGIKVGDEVTFVTSRNGKQVYTVCGIVWSPGVDVVINLYDLARVVSQPTAGSVFGTIEDAKRDFGATGARVFAANLQHGMDKQTLLKEIQKTLGERGLRAGDVRQIKYAIENTFFRILSLLNAVAFAAMAVASLGVTNTVMASVRSRRWQFGILRSIGVGRGQLLRLVLAEAVLLGLVGVALGLAAGGVMSVDARALSGSTLGYSPPMVIPWGVVWMGCVAVVAVALGASVIPAVAVASSDVLELLQAGRAST